jgi:hypothetical protein
MTNKGTGTQDRLMEIREQLAKAQAELREAEEAERAEKTTNAHVPAVILGLCESFAATTKDPNVARFVALTQPLIQRVADAFAHRCHARCGERECHHDDAIEKIVGVR